MHATGSPGSARSRSTSAGSGSPPGSVSSACLISEHCQISTMDDMPCKKVQSDPSSRIEPPPGLENLNYKISDPDDADFATSRPNFRIGVFDHDALSDLSPGGLPDFEDLLLSVGRRGILDVSGLPRLGTVADACSASSIRLPPGLDGGNNVLRSSVRLQQEMETDSEVPVQCITHCAPPAPPDYMPVVCRLQDRSMPPPPPEAAPEQVLRRLPKSPVPPPPPCAPPRLSAKAQLWACAPAPGMSMPPPPPVAAPEQALCRLSQTSAPPSPPCAPPKLPPQACDPALEMSIPPPPPMAAPEQALRRLPKSFTPTSPPCAPPKLSPQAQLLACAPAPPNWSCESHEPVVEFAVDSSTLPTVGSAAHRLGTCKPCAFFHTKGCGNGLNCIFCHLCAPGEKKRRQKVKRFSVKMSASNA